MAFSFPLSATRYLFRSRVISSTKAAGEVVLVSSVTGGRGSDGDPLLHNAHCPLPKVGKGIILFGPRLCVHPLVKFRHHLCKRKTLVKKK